MQISRKNFLKLGAYGMLAGSGILGLGAVLRFLGYVQEPSTTKEYDLGLAADYPEGSMTHFPEIPALLFHTQQGFTAVDLTCTHLGCSVAPEDGKLVCPCHGSTYALDGQVVKGPSRQRLNQFSVEINDEGKVILYV